MMQRVQPQRQSTLIAPESLQHPGVAQVPNAGKTLLDFSKDKVPGTSGIGPTPRPPGAGVRMPSSRSVFGVDEVWEREMAAVKKIEEQERKEAEARQKLEDEKAIKKGVKRHGKGKAVDSLVPPTTSAGPEVSGLEPTSSAVPRASTEPPLLPNVPLASTVPAPTTPSTTDSEGGQPERRKQRAKTKTRRAAAADAHGWDNSSDEEREKQKHIRGRQAAGDDSDSDVPLAAAAIRARQRRHDDSEEEDQPLAAVVAKKLVSPPRVTGNSTASGFNLPAFDFNKPTQAAADDDDDDDKPLGLKRLAAIGGDDDDQPLGMRYSMAPSQMMFQQQAQAQVQVQMQQQQMMMQMAAAAQVRQSMFNPVMGMGMGMGGMGMMNPAMSMNGMSMLGPPMAMGMNPAMAAAMQTPSLQLGSTLAVVDPAKHARLDRWRREVTDDD